MKYPEWCLIAKIYQIRNLIELSLFITLHNIYTPYMHNTVQLFGPQLKKPEFKATATEVYIRERVNMDKEPELYIWASPN